MATRRSVLSATAGSVALSGCLFGSTYGHGDLVVDNRSPEPLTFAVSVERHGTDPDAEPPSGSPPEGEPLWERSDEFDVDPDETVHEPGYVDEVGAYFVRGSVAGGASDGRWMSFPRANDGGITGPYVDVFASAPDRVTVSEAFID